MLYYLKKCGHQELGSVDATGRPCRGRYLLTSMNENVMAFFPPLSTAQLNDYTLLPIIPLYSGNKVYCNYVYHNDKFHGSTAAHKRNEYRIYLNRELEGNEYRFQTDDIMIMRKKEIEDGEGGRQTVYLMDLLQDRTSPEYIRCNNVIEEYPIRGGYGMLEDKIPSFEARAEIILATGEFPVAIDETVTRRVEETQTDALARLFNAATFRDFVMVGYNELCAITGTVIRYENYMNLEAAHIKPRSHGGLFLPNNGLALCRDLHWAFDKGFFTLNDRLEIQVHPNTTSDYLRTFHGQQIRVPTNSFFVPDLESIHYHNNAVYGLFLTTGRL